LSIGAIDQISSLVYYALLFLVMQYVYSHFRIIETTNVWYQWVGGYIAVDFLSYWFHRLSHRVNILWAGHVTHHSSELFNFSNGFRTSLFQGLYRIMFWAFLPVFGFSPIVLVIILKVSGIYDFLLHTEYIPKLGFLEKILITPSSHRVHHGKNDIYIDKNYGSTFLVWDKLFGTYQEETEAVKYGIKSPYTDKSPLFAIGHYYQHLWNTIKATNQWSDKIKLLFMPPEWKPDGDIAYRRSELKSRMPVNTHLKRYAYFQLSCCIVGLITMLVYKDYLSAWEIILCSGIGIMALTNVTVIFNESILNGFWEREFKRLIFAMLLVAITMYFNSRIYLWMAIVIFLSVSLILSKTSRVKHLGSLR
jgi:sterol desaturase/sphingolipid hydroxylase (fatty acid hydroxylase superfamily)